MVERTFVQNSTCLLIGGLLEWKYKLNIRLMKLIDAAVGQLAVILLHPSAHNLISKKISSILIIRPGGIGDAVLLIPAIQSIKNTFPDVQITVVAEKRNASVFTMVQAVDNILLYDAPRQFYQTLTSRYDIVIDTEQWHRLSAVVARMVRSTIIIGFSTNERRRMFTHSLPYSHDDYETVSFLRLLEPLSGGVDRTIHIPFLLIPEIAAGKAAAMLEPLKGESFIVIFPGASIPERRWGAERFRKVAEVLTALGTKVVIVGGKEDRQQGELIADAGLGLNLAGLTSLVETAAIIKRSALLLSGDSGVLHIAVALGVPTVSLFGSGRSKKWAPQGEHHIVINKELSCSPCTTFGTTPPCSNDNKCMREISVEEVVNAATMLLTAVGAMKSGYN